MNAQLIATEHGSYYDLPLRGAIVSRCYVDYAFGLQFFETDHEPEFRISCPFSLGVANSSSVHDPERAETLGEAIRLIHAAVAEARVYEDGTLDVAFDDGRRLTVAPDANYEAWEMTSVGGVVFVALPGGGLAIWDEPH